MTHTHILTERQRVEAAVYDERVRATFAALSDQDLTVERRTPPYPNREHVDFLQFAIGRMGPLAGARILEVGSGTGALSVYLALNGARVTGIDVSEETVALATRRAEANGVADRVEFRAVPIERLDDPDGTYDAIIGNQVLHHFELDEAMPNIGRLLRAGGRALFCEPVMLLPDVVRRARGNRMVTRWLPRKVDTPTERSVSPADVRAIQRTFPDVRIHPFQLFARLQNFVELSDGVFGVLERVDRLVLRLAPLRGLCRFVVFEVTADSGSRGVVR
jgi:2-polyprenyl-3-methyl-5-hydroxy-6-metoxy-1,4-benzoquinol methylase